VTNGYIRSTLMSLNIGEPCQRNDKINNPPKKGYCWLWRHQPKLWRHLPKS